MTEAQDRFEALLVDLADEGEELSSTVEWLSDRQLTSETPAQGWDIRTTVGHLKWTDEVAQHAVEEPEEFSAWLNEMLSSTPAEKAATFVDDQAFEAASGDFPYLLSRWSTARSRLQAAMRAKGPSERVPWFGPPMSVASMATARLMETWAHGQDIRDAIGVDPRPTPRLRHIAFLGARTRDFAFHANGLEPPVEEFRIELVLADPAAPGGHTTLSFGPDSASQSVTGTALDFCLLVTQRRHRDDLSLVASGDDAQRWLSIAQAFAGPPGSGRAPGTGTNEGQIG